MSITKGPVSLLGLIPLVLAPFNFVPNGIGQAQLQGDEQNVVAAVNALVNAGPYGSAPYSPSGGDDSGNISALLNAYGTIALVPNATYTVANPIVLPVNKAFTINGNGAIINSTMTPTGGPGGFAKSVFYGTAQALTGGTTLAAGAAAGDTTITVTSAAGISIGQRIILVDVTGLLGQQFLVKNKVGAVLTLDRPVEYTFPITTTTVTPSLVVRDGKIDDVTISGTGDRAYEIGAAYRVYVSNVRVTADAGAFTAFLGSFDIASLDCVAEHIYGDGGATANVGLALESAQGCAIYDFDVTAVTVGNGIGLYLTDTRNSEVRSGTVERCGIGVEVADSSATDVGSSRTTTLFDITSQSNTSAGFLLTGGLDNFNIEDCRGIRNNIGCNIGDGSAASPTLVNVKNCVFSNNTTTGVTISSTGPSPTSTVNINGLRTNANGTFGMSITGTNLTIASQWTITSANTSGALNINGTTSETVVTQSDWTLAATVGVTVASGGAPTLKFDQLTLRMTGGSGSFIDYQTGTGIVYLSNIKSSGGANGVYMGHAVACTLRNEANVNLSSCTTPYTIDATARANFGTVIANAATPVAVSYPNITATEAPILTRTVNGGTATQVTSTTTAGVGFSFVALAGETGTYTWKLPLGY